MAMDYNFARSQNEFAEMIRQMVDDGIRRAKEELAKEMVTIDNGQRQPDIRMACLHLAKDTVLQGKAEQQVIALAKSYTDFVLTGKKPREA